MAISAVGTAQIMCSFGQTPTPLNALPTSKVMIENKPSAVIMDNAPMVNIMPFGMCLSPSNPANIKGPVVVPGSAPCVPVIAAPWMPGSPTVLIGGKPALNNSCKCMCNWAGVIQIMMPGATKTMVP